MRQVGAGACAAGAGGAACDPVGSSVVTAATTGAAASTASSADLPPRNTTAIEPSYLFFILAERFSLCGAVYPASYELREVPRQFQQFSAILEFVAGQWHTPETHYMSSPKILSDTHTSKCSSQVALLLAFQFKICCN